MPGVEFDHKDLTNKFPPVCPAERNAIMYRSDLLALDSKGNVFSFDPSNPEVKHWDSRSNYFLDPGAYNSLYLVAGQWYHHAGDIFTELVPRNRPNYAAFFTREQARDWFLAVGVPLPEELGDLRPGILPTPLGSDHAQLPQECLVTLAQAAALVHRTKRALEMYKKRGLPKPRVRGGGGKPSLWAYAEIRIWLTKTFEIALPERFFADRNASRN
jgi:hypothetical protein